MAPEVAPYGTWESPINPDDFASASTKLDSIQVDVSAIDLVNLPLTCWIEEDWQDIPP